MTDMIDPMVLNLIYVIVGGCLTLMFMWMGCKLFNHLVSFSLGDELAKGNIAVGLMMMGMFIGIGTALGLVIGLSMN